MFGQLTRWLGKERSATIGGALIATGLASLILNLVAGDQDWSLAGQTILVVLFLGIATWTVGSRLQGPNRLRLFFTILPALGLVLLALILPASIFPLMLGLAFGWLLASQFLLRHRMSPEYKEAIKQLRNQDYKKAAKAITELINKEPNDVNHYRFRAEMYRLAGQMNKAIKDYEKACEVAPDDPTGYNGLAEVYLQQGDYETAREYGLDAFEREPDFWVAPYNLGMIEDRLDNSQAVIEHLNIVLNRGLPDSRHRLLTYFWLARAYYRLGDSAQSEKMLDKMMHEKAGLKEWTIILEDEQASTLRGVLADDVELARAVIEDHADADSIFGEI